MRRLLLFVLFCCGMVAAQSIPFPGPGMPSAAGGSAPTYTITNAKDDSTGTGCTGAVTCAAGAFANPLTNPSVVFACSVNATAASSAAPTDTAGHTFVGWGPGNVNYHSTALALQCWYAVNTATTANNVVSLNTGGGIGSWALVAWEITGTASTSVRDGALGVGYASSGTNNNTGVGGGQNVSAGTMVTVTANDLIVAAGTCFATTATTGTGYTNAMTSTLGGSEFKLQTSAGSITPTFSCPNSTDYAAMSIAIKAQ